MPERLWCRGCEVSARGESRCWCCGQVMTVRDDPVRTGKSVGSVETRGVPAGGLTDPELVPARPGPATPAEVVEAVREQVVRTAMRRTRLRSFWAHLAP